MILPLQAILYPHRGVNGCVDSAVAKLLLPPHTMLFFHYKQMKPENVSPWCQSVKFQHLQIEMADTHA